MRGGRRTTDLPATGAGVISPEDAEAIAAKLLAGLRTKSGGSHLAHARRVAEHVRLAHPSDVDLEAERAVVAALLHDVVEKAGVSVDDVRSLTNDERIVELVDLLTQRSGETERSYLARCASDPTALSIKRIDLLDKLVADDAVVSREELARIRREAQRRIEFLDGIAAGASDAPEAHADTPPAPCGMRFTLAE
jgi:(p)ppGpp synthase/HD superfamily hydrolase